MYRIYIDTTDRKNNLVELYEGTKFIDKKFGEIDVVSAIKELVENNNIKLSDIKSFDMNEGPGSFTGLKVGAAIVNILNWALLAKSSKNIVLPKYQVSKFDDLVKN